MIEQYVEQVKLLVNVLPYVAKEDCFALKGGTAINLFIRDLPRLSVDIDLAYVGFEDKYYEATIGEVMEFMAAHEGCTLNGVAKCYYSKVDGDDEPHIRDLYITSMVYTGEPTEEFMADFDKLMPLETNPHRDEFLSLANSDDGTDRR